MFLRHEPSCYCTSNAERKYQSCNSYALIKITKNGLLEGKRKRNFIAAYASTWKYIAFNDAQELVSKIRISQTQPEKRVVFKCIGNIAYRLKI